MESKKKKKKLDIIQIACSADHHLLDPLMNEDIPLIRSPGRRESLMAVPAEHVTLH